MDFGENNPLIERVVSYFKFDMSIILDSLILREGSLTSFSRGMSSDLNVTLSGLRNSLSLKVLYISDGCGETELDIAFNRTA